MAKSRDGASLRVIKSRLRCACYIAYKERRFIVALGKKLDGDNALKYSNVSF